MRGEKEHWRDASSLKEESHMIQHQLHAHKDMKSLEDPRVQLQSGKVFQNKFGETNWRSHKDPSRGNVLSQRGEYNRFNITRLVLDSKWEEETWNKLWESREEESPEDEMSMVGSSKSKSKGRGSIANSKIRQIEDEDGHVWGEPLVGDDEAQAEFLRRGEEMKPTKPNIQSKLMVLSGVEWWAYEVVKSIIVSATTLASPRDGGNVKVGRVGI